MYKQSYGWSWLVNTEDKVYVFNTFYLVRQGLLCVDWTLFIHK